MNSLLLFMLGTAIALVALRLGQSQLEDRLAQLEKGSKDKSDHTP